MKTCLRNVMADDKYVTSDVSNTRNNFGRDTKVNSTFIETRNTLKGLYRRDSNLHYAFIEIPHEDEPEVLVGVVANGCTSTHQLGMWLEVMTYPRTNQGWSNVAGGDDIPI